jgi:hypothetical protein
MQEKNSFFLKVGPVVPHSTSAAQVIKQNPCTVSAPAKSRTQAYQHSVHYKTTVNSFGHYSKQRRCECTHTHTLAINPTVDPEPEGKLNRLLLDSWKRGRDATVPSSLKPLPTEPECNAKSPQIN